MDILKARKKARGKGPGKKPREERADAPASTPPAGPATPSVAPSRPSEGKTSAEEVAGLATALAVPPTDEAAADIDEAISQIEREQADRRASGGSRAGQIQQSVADFVAGFDPSGTDEEASYRHSFAREREVLDTLDRHLSFRLAEEEYAIELVQVRETIKVPPITEMPRNPSYIAGIISLRGMIMPVIDLRRRLGLRADPPTRTARIIVTELDGQPLGLLVDQVRDVVWVRPESIEPPPSVLPVKEADFLVGVGRAPSPDAGEDRVLILIRLDAVGRIERGAAA